MLLALGKKNRNAHKILSKKSLLLTTLDEETPKRKKDSDIKEMLKNDLPSSVYGVLEEHWKSIGIDK